MSATFNLVLKGGTVVNEDGVGVRDVGVRAGRIAAIGRVDVAKAGEVIDARGLHVLPGVIDTQVHFREPGLEHKEDLASGSRGAVLGGVTAVFEMPNTKPLTTTAATLADKVARARNRMFCDFAFYVGGTRENIDEIPRLEKLEGSAGIKVFMGSSTGDLLARLKERMHLRRPGDPSSHPEWRDEEAAIISTRRLVCLAEKHKRRVHVLHVSTAAELSFLADHKDWASVEVTPHHLTLVAPDCYEKLGTYAQMNPPVRDDRHRQAIWAGVAAGIVDVLGSDHAPHTLVPIMLDHVNAGRLSIERFVDLTSHGPQRLFGIRGKGRIAAGYDADFVIVDLKREETITNARVASRAGWTPYDGKRVKGWPIGTFVRGRRVMWDGEIIGAAHGAPVGFLEGF